MYAPNQLHSSVVYDWISNLLDDQFYKWINYIEKKNLSRKSDKKSCWFWLFILLCKMVSSHIYTLLYIATCLSSSHIKHGSFDRKNFLKIHFNFSILFQNVNDIVAIRCTRICAIWTDHIHLHVLKISTFTYFCYQMHFLYNSIQQTTN